MGCPNCHHLDVDPHMCVHQHYCPDYTGGEDADKLRTALNGVELYDHADVVLMKLPNTDMIRTDVIGVDGVEAEKHGFPFFIVDWVYPGVTLRMEKVIIQEPKYGDMAVYAVQQIRSNDE